MLSICAGFRPNRCINSAIASKISALCRIGAENVVCARISGPMARTTDPILLDVSIARIISCFFMVADFYIAYINILFTNARFWAVRPVFFVQIF